MSLFASSILAKQCQNNSRKKKSVKIGEAIVLIKRAGRNSTTLIIFFLNITGRLYRHLCLKTNFECRIANRSHVPESASTLNVVNILPWKHVEHRICWQHAGGAVATKHASLSVDDYKHVEEETDN